MRQIKGPAQGCMQALDALSGRRRARQASMACTATRRPPARLQPVLRAALPGHTLPSQATHEAPGCSQRQAAPCSAQRGGGRRGDSAGRTGELPGAGNRRQLPAQGCVGRRTGTRGWKQGGCAGVKVWRPPNPGPAPWCSNCNTSSSSSTTRGISSSCCLQPLRWRTGQAGQRGATTSLRGTSTHCQWAPLPSTHVVSCLQPALAWWKVVGLHVGWLAHTLGHKSQGGPVHAHAQT